MDSSDEMLLRALIEGSLKEEDRLRVDDLLARSEEARRQLSTWRGWKELNISLVADHTPDTNGSALLQIAIETMRGEVLGIGREIANRTLFTDDFVADSDSHPGVSEPEWINRITGITVGEEIGRGAMGVVYEGFDQTLGRRVAIKIPSRQCVHNPESRERFTREAQAAAQLCHENIVAIHSIQHVDGMPILVLQFIDGETLAARVERSGRLSAADLMQLATQIARGLSTAHVSGIVHRDLKPENLMLEHASGVVRIADFGLAKRDSSSLLTQPNVVAGTPAYMSPEQTLGQPLDARSDLFSFGSVMRFAATGQSPFGSDDTDLVLHRIRSQSLEPLHQIRPDLPVAVCNAFDRLLIKDVSSRTKSASEFLNHLSEQRVQPPEWSSKRLAMVGSGIFVLVVLLLWGFNAVGRKDRSNSQSTTSNQVELSDKTSLEFPFSIRGMERRFRTLEDVITSAEDGQEIIVDGDGPYESPRIDIGRKRLSIVANKGASPLFVNKMEPGVSNLQFLKSDNDLHLSGIRVEWLVEIEVTDLQKMNDMPAIFCNDGTLKLDDCAIRRGSSGGCAYGSRSIEIRGCTFEGGSHCLCWTAQGYSVIVENSTLRGKNGCLILFPLSNSQGKGTNQFKMVNVTSVGETAIEIGLTRAQSNATQFQSEGCVFDNSNLLSLVGGPNLARQVVMPASMLSLMQNAVDWQESKCRHRTGQTYLSGRMLIRPERRYSSGFVGLSAWRKLWQSDFSGSNELNQETKEEPRNPQ